MIVVVVWRVIARWVWPGMAGVVLRGRDYAVGSEVCEHGGCEGRREHGAPVIVVHLIRGVLYEHGGRRRKRKKR